MLLRNGVVFSLKAKNHSIFYDLHRKTKKFDLYVVRNNVNNDNFQDSQPCIECQRNLKKMGFKNIYYSLNEGYEKKKIKNLDSKHISKAQKNYNFTGKNYLKI